MNYTFDTQSELKSWFVSEDYFPAIVQFSQEELNNRYVKFSCRDTDMFELVGDSKTGIIKQLTLTLCNTYEIIDKPLPVPNAEVGIMLLNEEEDVECEGFVVKVFQDGLRIDISVNDIHDYFRCGQLVFAFDESDSLVSLFVTDLLSENISHVLRELNCNDI